MQIVLDINADLIYDEIKENQHIEDQEKYEVLGMLHTIVALGMDNVFYPIMMQRFQTPPTIEAFADELWQHSAYILEKVKLAGEER